MRRRPSTLLLDAERELTTTSLADARALFERSVSLLEPAAAKPIWDRMAAYEYQYGDHLAAQKMAKRYADAFPESPSRPPSSRFARARH